jgi:indole-3-glycerol phosphate synthase
MTTILDEIVATKREEIVAAQSSRPWSELERALEAAPPPRDFFAPLAAGGSIKLIAEVKKASPSKGVIREDFDPLDIARTYRQNGASCLSVLTDVSYFQGSLTYLQTIRSAVDIPVLRKDFLIDRYQIVEARCAGADAVLLIAECLDDRMLGELLTEAKRLGMTALVEFYEPENLSRVIDAGATLIGVNNRDLRTFEVDVAHTIRMRERIPDGCVLVGESGIHTRDDVLRLESAGVHAMLVGESLMRQTDIGAAVRHLLGK